MDREIENKVIVITGGAQGIGFNIGDAFLLNGAKTVILLDINEELGKQAATSLNNKYGDNRAVYMKCDVTKDLDAISEEIFKNYKVEVLVNNAGICDETNIRKTIEVNVISVLEWGYKFFEHMRIDTGGHGGTILNVASSYAYQFTPWLPVYKTSKQGVISFTKTLGHPRNYESYGVRVIAICPGATKTSLIKNFTPSHLEKGENTINLVLQSVESVGKATVDVFKMAESSTAWEIKKDTAIREVQPES